MKKTVYLVFHRTNPSLPRWTIETTQPARTARRMNAQEAAGKSGFYARRITHKEFLRLTPNHP